MSVKRTPALILCALLCLIGLQLMPARLVAEWIDSDTAIGVCVENSALRQAIIKRLRIEGFGHVVLLTGEPEVILATLDATRPPYIILDDSRCALEVALIDRAYRAKAKKVLLLAPFSVYPKGATLPLKEKDLTGKSHEKGERHTKWKTICHMRTYNTLPGTQYLLGIYPHLYATRPQAYAPPDENAFQALIARIAEGHQKNRDFVVLTEHQESKIELLHTDDLATAVIFLLRRPLSDHTINIGYGNDIALSDLAALMCRVLKYRGKVFFTLSEGESPTRAILDSSHLFSLGWQPCVPLQQTLPEHLESFQKALPPYDPIEDGSP